MVKCFLRLDRIVFETLRFWIGIGVKGRFINWTSTRPETTTTYFV
jgi:hypothetical protein